MLRCVTARAGSVLDDGPILPEKNRKANGQPAAATPHAPLRDLHGAKGHDDMIGKSKPPGSSAVAITASSAPPPQPPAQLQPGDAPPLPLFGGPNALDERKLDLWTRAASNSQLWDLQLRTTADNELVHSNTLDLAAVSPFFYKALSSGKAMRVINVNGIRGSTLRFAVQSIYAREVAINWRNVEEVLDLSEKIKIGALHEACALFLMEFQAAEPRLAWTLSTKYKCEKVRAAVRKHVVKNFDSIVSRRGGAKILKSIQHKELSGIFADDGLSIHTEMLLVRAVEQMLVCEREEGGRSSGLEQHDYTALLLAMRVEHLEAHQLNECLCSPPVQGCPRVVARFANVALHHASHIPLDFPARNKRESSWYTWRVDPQLVGGKARSESFAITGSKEQWCLVATSGSGGGDLAIFLSVSGDVSETWREKVAFTIRMANHAKPKNSIERGLDGEILDCSRQVWGFKAFAPMAEVGNLRSGFLTADGSIVLQVHARSLPMDNLPGPRAKDNDDKPAYGSAPVLIGEVDT